MRLAACAVVIPVLFAASCGYVGPVLPPSPEIPTPITDLAVVERGDQIVATFTAPPRTVDGVAITHFHDIELRVTGDKSTQTYPVPLPSPSDKEDPQPKPVAFSIDASPWTGQHIAVSVRTSVKKTDHFSGWSEQAGAGCHFFARKARGARGILR